MLLNIFSRAFCDIPEAVPDFWIIYCCKPISLSLESNFMLNGKVVKFHHMTKNDAVLEQ